MRYNKKQISKALAMAQRALKAEERPAAMVAGVLNRYMDCSEIDGVGGEEHETMRSAIFATMGDAYRHEGNAELAAKWYRRASQLSTGGHAGVYAHIVCQHQLADFYEDALKVLQDDQGRWAARPFRARFFHWVRTWADSERRKVARSKKGNLQFLQQHAVAKAA